MNEVIKRTRSSLRYDREPGAHQSPRRLCRQDLLLLCAGCADHFRATPEKYLSSGQDKTVPLPINSEAAPKSPDITRFQLRHRPRSSTPARCTRKSSAPDPGRAPSAEWRSSRALPSPLEEENPELVSMTRRFWISVALTIPVLMLGMSDLIPGQPIQRLLSVRAIGWIELLLATPVVLWAGWPFFERGWASLVNRSLNMFTLIALGTGNGLHLQRRRRSPSRQSFRRTFPRHERRSSPVLRSRRRHHRAGSPRPGARIARAQPHLRGHPCPAEALTENRAPRPRRRHRN